MTEECEMTSHLKKFFQLSGIIQKKQNANLWPGLYSDFYSVGSDGREINGQHDKQIKNPKSTSGSATLQLFNGDGERRQNE